MKRILTIAAIAFTSTAAVLLVACYIRSYYRGDLITYDWYNGHTWRRGFLVETSRGYIHFAGSTTHWKRFDAPPGLYLHEHAFSRWQHLVDQKERDLSLYPGPRTFWTTHGFWGSRFAGENKWIADASYNLFMPEWLLIAVISMFPVFVIIREYVRKKLSPGLCPTCHYDLRYSPGRCPECGTAPSKPV